MRRPAAYRVGLTFTPSLLFPESVGTQTGSWRRWFGPRRLVSQMTTACGSHPYPVVPWLVTGRCIVTSCVCRSCLPPSLNASFSQSLRTIWSTSRLKRIMPFLPICAAGLDSGRTMGTADEGWARAHEFRALARSCAEVNDTDDGRWTCVMLRTWASNFARLGSINSHTPKRTGSCPCLWAPVPPPSVRICAQQSTAA